MPGTKRPDGTFRKPRRIKEGYVPQDEVPLYESKGKQLAKARETGPAIPGLPSGGTGSGGIFNMKIDTFDHKALLGPPKIPGLHPEDSAQMAITNLNNSGDNNATASKKSNKKKKKSASSGSSPAVKNQVDHQEQHENYVNFSSSNQNNTTTNSEELAVDPAKKLRNLKKKLRDIENLEKKLNDGSLANPEPEQLEKVRRKGVMLEELAELEAMVANMST